MRLPSPEVSRTTSAPASSAAACLAVSGSATTILQPGVRIFAQPMPCRPRPPAPMISSELPACVGEELTPCIASDALRSAENAVSPEQV